MCISGKLLGCSSSNYCEGEPEIASMPSHHIVAQGGQEDRPVLFRTAMEEQHLRIKHSNNDSHLAKVISWIMTKVLGAPDGVLRLPKIVQFLRHNPFGRFTSVVKTKRRFETSRTTEPMVLNVHVPVVTPAALFSGSTSSTFLSRSIGKPHEQIRHE